MKVFIISSSPGIVVLVPQKEACEESLELGLTQPQGLGHCAYSLDGEGAVDDSD